MLEPLGADWKQEEPGTDHAEAITLLDDKRLAIGYDSPADNRFHEPATVEVDIVKL